MNRRMVGLSRSRVIPLMEVNGLALEVHRGVIHRRCEWQGCSQVSVVLVVDMHTERRTKLTIVMLILIWQLMAGKMSLCFEIRTRRICLEIHLVARCFSFEPKRRIRA